MANKLKAAVIGCGRIGAEFDADPKRKYVATHVGAYMACPGVDLAGVVDPDAAKLNFVAKRWPRITGLYKDIKSLFENQRVDLVSICTPPETHFSVIKEILRYPVRAVFCEKPIAANLKDAREIISLCKRKKVTLQIDHQRRFDRLHGEIEKMIDKGAFGRFEQANFHYTNGIRNTGTHMFDLLRFLFGNAAWIQAHRSRVQPASPADLNLDGMIRFEQGGLATFQALDVKNYLVFELTAFFEKGMLRLTHSGFDYEIYKPASSRLFSGYKELKLTGRPFKADTAKNFMVEGVRHLADCVKRGRTPVSSGEDGYQALNLIERGIQSAASNGKLIKISGV